MRKSSYRLVITKSKGLNSHNFHIGLVNEKVKNFITTNTYEFGCAISFLAALGWGLGNFVLFMNGQEKRSMEEERKKRNPNENLACVESYKDPWRSYITIRSEPKNEKIIR